MGRKDAINSSLDVIVAAAARAEQGDENGGVLQAITTTIYLAAGQGTSLTVL